jgi:hypothetical protein
MAGIGGKAVEMVPGDAVNMLEMLKRLRADAGILRPEADEMFHRVEDHFRSFIQMFDQKVDTGGPAFPTDNAAQTGNTTWHHEGMSLRDYFAGKAIVALKNHSNVDWVTRRAYEIADGMIKARGKQS